VLDNGLARTSKVTTVALEVWLHLILPLHYCPNLNCRKQVVLLKRDTRRHLTCSPWASVDELLFDPRRLGGGSSWESWTRCCRGSSTATAACPSASSRDGPWARMLSFF